MYYPMRVVVLWEEWTEVGSGGKEKGSQWHEAVPDVDGARREAKVYRDL